MPMRRALTGLLIAGAMLAVPAVAQNSRDAERKLEKIQKELKSVAAERRAIEDQRGSATRKLRDADEKVGQSNRRLREIEARMAREQASLAQLKPYQVNRKIKGGSVYYLYPNPREGVLYVGGQKQYTAYQGYQVQTQIAEENLMAADMYSTDTMGWGDWNIWGAGW